MRRETDPAVNLLAQQKGVQVIACDREPFRKLTLPQTDQFIKAHPEAKPIIDIIRSTKA